MIQNEVKKYLAATNAVKKSSMTDNNKKTVLDFVEELMLRDLDGAIFKMNGLEFK